MGVLLVGDKRPNVQLNSWFVRSGWSKGELARQVNRRARQTGAHHVSTDTSRVRRWLDGEQPREPIPRILSDLFSERFGCVVSVEDLGLPPQPGPPQGSGVDLPWAGPQTLRLIGELSRSDLMLNRRGYLSGSLVMSAGPALLEPMQRWLATPACASARVSSQEHRARGGRLSEPELELLEATTQMFRRWDAQCGGGLRRKAVVGQLHEVTELLQEPHPPRVSRRLFRIAAELSHLAGWMTYDMGLHPSAQRYFVLALHAAKEARDRPLGAMVLSDMARQMTHLGRPEDALELVHLAQYGSRDTAGARTRSMLYALEARAHANAGEVNRCRRAVGMAEDVFTEAGSSEDPDWIQFFTEGELYGEIAHSYRDLARTSGRGPAHASLAEPVMQRAVRYFRDDVTQQRTYALNLVGMATVHLLQGDGSQAASCLGEAAGTAGRIRSERVNSRLRQVTEEALRRHGTLPEVRELPERLAGALPEAPGLSEPARRRHAG
ncbi:NsdA [Wenjunlia vitaminophila]|uniref:NsdA n=1 Tax=Wenjunlia vitaminophila TaxID=76728 RepID=A0A0T6LY88_WENVI|nr:hypothetical protein [Wenjunlia vitaminophila]KRV50993.1 NsdA [Wenjunlia vitaminophila]